MSWNYRIIRHRDNRSGAEWFQLHEVYPDDTGKPDAMSAGERTPRGETLEEMKGALRMMLAACDEPEFRPPVEWFCGDKTRSRFATVICEDGRACGR